MFYPVPYEYHDLIVDRRGGRPLRSHDVVGSRTSASIPSRRRGRK